MTDSSTQGHTRISLRTMEHIVAAAIASVPGTKAIEAKLAAVSYTHLTLPTIYSV